MATNTFRVVRGIHVTGKGATRKVYERGSLIHSQLDLDKIFVNKFERLMPVQAPLTEATEAPLPTPADLPEEDEVEVEEVEEKDPYHLQDMTKAELLDFAEGEEIDIPEAAKTKGQVLKAIKEALASR